MVLVVAGAAVLVAVVDVVFGVALGFAARAAVTEVVVDSTTGGESTTAVVSVVPGATSEPPSGDWVATCTPGFDGPFPQPAASSARLNARTTRAGRRRGRMVFAVRPISAVWGGPLCSEIYSARNL